MAVTVGGSWRRYAHAALLTQHGHNSVPPLGTIIDGKYRLEAVIGHGGFGVVYRARHLGLDRQVAIKLLAAHDTSGRFFERFRREAAVLARLTHPHIVGVTDFGVALHDDGWPYLVMELAPGKTLEQHAGQPVPLDDALPLLKSIADAVDAAHRAGVLHVDLKPANVVVDTTNVDAPSVKVIDFGLARLFSAAPAVVDRASKAGVTAPGVTHDFCTPEYCATELTRG